MKAAQLKHQVAELFIACFSLHNSKCLIFMHEGHVSLVIMVIKVLPAAYHDRNSFLTIEIPIYNGKYIPIITMETKSRDLYICTIMQQVKLYA